MPDGFTPVDFNITYDCGDTSKIKNSLQMRIDGTTGVVDQYNLVARRRSSDNAPDVGIRIENLGGGVANIPFQNGILPLILPGMAPSTCAPGQLIWSVVSWKQENFRAPPPLPSSCGKRRRCVLINATLRHSYPCCSSAYLYSAFSSRREFLPPAPPLFQRQFCL